MSIREYDFIAGVETSAIPDPTTAVADEDIANYGQIQDEFTSRQTFENKVADLTALKAIPASDRYNNQLVSVEVSGEVILYYFDSASADAGDDVFVVQPTVGTGRWIRQRRNLPQVLDEGSAVGFPSKIDFVGTGVSVAQIGETATVTISSGGGGGGGGSGDPLRDVTNAELSSDPEFEAPAQFLDDAEEDQKATLVDMTQSQSAWRHNTGDLAGNIKRDKASEYNLDGVTGLITVNPQMFSPKAIALSPSSTSTTVTFTFNGDMTSWFLDDKKVVILRKYIDGETNSDGKTFGIPIIDGSNLPVIFVLDNPASSYDSVADETEVAVLNPGGYDLDFDLSTSDFPDKLLLAPWNVVVKANVANAAPTGGQYETLDVKELYMLDAVALQGEAFLQEITDVSIDGRILKFDVEVSSNGTYRTFKLLEDDSGNETWRFFGQVGSNTPVYLGSKSYNIGSASEEDGGQFFFTNRAQLAIADNGMGISVYEYYTGALFGTRAVTFNLTDVTPVIADIVTNGAGAGIVYQATQAFGQIAYDRTDLSFAMIFVRRDDNLMRGYAYTSGGTVYDSTSSFTDHAVYNNTSGNRPPMDSFVSGTGSSHRTHAFFTDNGSFDVRGTYYNQGSNTINSYNGGSDISSGGTTGDPVYPFSVFETATKGVVYYGSRPVTIESAHFRYFDLTGGAPSISSDFQVFLCSSTKGTTIRRFYGYSSQAYANAHRVLRQFAVSNPSDGNSTMFALEVADADNVDKAIVCEVRDITNYKGVQISHYANSGDQNAINNTAVNNQKVGQTFTTAVTAERLRTVSVRLVQNGTIASGETIVCKIYNTSAGAPTTVLATSSNTYDCSKITKNSNGQWCYFNFDSVTLSNSTVYGIVLEVTYATSGSNYIGWYRQAVGAFGGGSHYRFDGTTWTGTSNDQVFEINGEWVKEISQGYANDSGTSFSNVAIQCQETSLGKIDSNQVQALFRRMTSPSNTASEYTRCGIPYRLVATWGSGNNQSTWTEAENAAYASGDFDPYCVFNISCGGTDSKALNLNTGAEDDTQNSNDRSPFSHVVSGATGMASVTDASFQSGKCLNFNGSSDFKAYTDSDCFDLLSTKSFCIEAEIKFDTTASTMNIIGKYNGGASAGWILDLHASAAGSIRFLMINGAGANIGSAVSVSSTVSAATYYVVRVTYAGDGTSPKIFLATSPTGSFTEVAYSSQTVVSASVTVALALNVARINNSSNWYDGKIGYVKINNGSSTFNFTGFKSMAAVTNIQNGGTAVYGKRMIGENGVNTNYAEFSEMKQNVALVDSYPLVAKFNHTFASTGRYKHIDIQTERVNTSDNTNYENYEFTFVKI
jgi:hypothetical protein